MVITSYLLAGLIVLVRVYVPISETILGGWFVRLLLFLLWCGVIAKVGGKNLGQFLRTLIARRAELVCYAGWVLILTFFWWTQEGEHLLTSYLLNAYLGTFPFYILGSYYCVNLSEGRRMALAMGVVVGAACLQAIPIVWQNPELVRMGAINSTAETRSLGIGSYGDLTGFALVLPFLITGSLKSKGLVRILGITSCVALMALLMIATLSGIILLTGLAVIGCVLFYLLTGGSRFNGIVLPSSAILVIVLASVFVFPSVYERPEFGRFYDKLAKTFFSLPAILAGRADDPTLRYTSMLDSLHVFLENPVIGATLGAKGIGTAAIGGHSSWMDALADYGLIGGLPYLLFHLLVFRRLWQAWRDDHQNALYWGCLLSCALYIFYGFFNVTTQGTTIALFLYVTASGGQRSIVLMGRRDTAAVRRRVKC